MGDHMSIRFCAPVLLAIGMVLTACTTEPAKYSPSPVTTSTSATRVPPADLAADTSAIELEQSSRPVVEPFVRRGSEPLVGTPGAPDSPVDGDIVLSFDATPIDDVVGVIFNEYLNSNYTIDPAVKGNITYRSSRGLTEEELLPTLENLLGQANAALIESGNGYRVVPAADAPSLAGTSILSDSVSPDGGFRSVVIPVRFIAAQDLADIVASHGVQASVNADRNLLIVAGTTAQLQQVKRLVETFDVNWMQGMSFALLPLEHADSKEVAQELRSIFLTGDASVSGGARVTSIDRLNAVLVVSPHPDLLDEYRLWIEKLDSVSGRDGKALYVYRVQHGRAEDLAEVLNEIFTPVATRRVEFNLETDDSLSYPGAAPFQNKGVALEQSVAGDFGNSGLSTAPVRVIADKTNNALLILGNRENYAIVESALRRLDVEPLQVLIEASIVEVILGDELKYGLEWFIRGHTDDYDGEGLLDFGLGATPGIGPVIPGFSYVVKKAGEVRVALNALAEDSRINVLSSPALMVLNNETATIRVGDEVPIATRSSVSTIDPNSPTVNEIEYRDTGVLLKVTPRVNVSGMVTMDIDQEVSNVTETTTSSLDSPTFLQRRITSSVAVKSGETIVLGGLIREEETTREGGVPGLYKIPVIGKLFGTTSKAKRRTELIVLITPRAVYQPDDMRAVTEEYERRMIGLAPRLLNSVETEIPGGEAAPPGGE
jgi:general secretion pathway protein D